MARRYLLVSSIVIFILILESCSSGKGAYKQGDYYEAVITSVNRLRRNDNHKKSVETLRSAYPLAITFYENQANTGKASPTLYKWRGVVQSYTLLQNMRIEILRSPGALKTIPNPKDYSTELADARKNAAEESYVAGARALAMGNRQQAKEAHSLFITTNDYVAGYKDVHAKIQEALWAATLKVVMEPIPKQARNLEVNVEYLENRISEYLRSENVDQYVRFFTVEEARAKNLQADHIVKLGFDEFTIGQVYLKETQIPVERDSVVVAYSVGTGNVQPVKIDERRTYKPTVMPPVQSTTPPTGSTPPPTQTKPSPTPAPAPTQPATPTPTPAPAPGQPATSTTAPATTPATQPTQPVTPTPAPATEPTQPTAPTPAPVSESTQPVTPAPTPTPTVPVTTTPSTGTMPAPEPAAPSQSPANPTPTNGSGAATGGDTNTGNTPVTTPPASSGGSENDKVTICHIPPGNPANRKVMSVPRSALVAHLGHGDIEGACPPNDLDATTADKVKADKDKAEKEKAEKEKAEKEKKEKEAKEKKKNEKGNNKGNDAASAIAINSKSLIASTNSKNWIIDDAADTTKILGKVKATVAHFKKTIASNGIMDLRIIDAKTNAVILQEKIPAEYIWVSEWATFNGDERALSAEQLQWVNQREQQQPSSSELFNSFATPMFEQVTNKLRSFYKQY